MALAQEAARIMSEQGIDDYGLAKRKAAERLGASDIAVLPKNTEIEAALAAHHRLFEGSKHSNALSALRRTALQAMKLLDSFQPRLVGPVLSGTADANGKATIPLPVPNDPGLGNGKIYMQVLSTSGSSFIASRGPWFGIVP